MIFSVRARDLHVRSVSVLVADDDVRTRTSLVLRSMHGVQAGEHGSFDGVQKRGDPL